MRVFLAVPCGEEFARSLSTALDPLRQLSGLRWTPAEQFHFTLQFLGEWPENRVLSLKNRLEHHVWGVGFDLEADCLGAFPALDSPKVLFLQMKNDDSLAALSRSVRSLVQESWPESPADLKRFRCHLTVARVRAALGQVEIGQLADYVLPKILPKH